MSKVCEICGRGPRAGFSVSHAHNRNKRRWEINLQNMHVLIDGSPKRIRVCTRCIQAGKIERPKFVLKERKIKVLEPSLAKAKVAIEEIEEQSGVSFFTDKSIVDIIFKPKKKKAGEDVEETETDTESTSDSDDVKSTEPQMQIVETEIISDDGIDIYGDH